MARYSYLSNVGGQIAIGTAYIKASDGSQVASAADPTTWTERGHRFPLHIQGNMNGGTSVVQVEMAADRSGTVLRTTPNLLSQLNNGVDVDLADGRFWRVKVTQSGSSTVSIALVMDTASEGLPA